MRFSIHLNLPPDIRYLLPLLTKNRKKKQGRKGRGGGQRVRFSDRGGNQNHKEKDRIGL